MVWRVTEDEEMEFFHALGWGFMWEDEGHKVCLETGCRDFFVGQKCVSEKTSEEHLCKCIYMSRFKLRDERARCV